tara:strand:+ start:813 stop:1193 length:381 start_codon:yes stop_codon:yes gene_type:complete
MFGRKKNTVLKQMEDFHQAAKKNDVSHTLVIGGTFGIFLTFGNAWSDFLKEVIISAIPNHDNPVLNALIFALSASGLGILILFLLIKFDIYMSKIKTPKLPIFNSRLTNIKPSKEVKSRNDVRNVK